MRTERNKGLRRSEAVSKFKAVLNAWVLREPHEMTDVIAERLVKEAIDMGMLPPPRDANQRSSYGFARVFEFESEDT